MAIPDIGGTWSSHDDQRVASMYTHNGVRRELLLGGGDFEGRESIAARAQGWLSAIPDLTVEVRRVTEGSNATVAGEWTARGTHQHDAPGYPAKGEQVKVLGVSVCTMEGDLIKEEWCYFDMAGMLAGAGVLS